jgi:protein-S-isoprenylcysteine O-methyltransferase
MMPFAVGIALQVATLRALKTMRMTRLGIQAAHRFVSDGPCRWPRHPGYLSNLVCRPGTALQRSSSAALPATVLVLILLVRRIQVEESMLLEAFGPAHHGYWSRPWHLIPWLY